MPPATASSTGRDPARRWFESPAWPIAVLVLVIGLDLLGGRRASVLGQAGIAPLVAAGLVGPRRTAAYGLAALGTVALLGVYNRDYEPVNLTAQIERLLLVGLSGAIGTALARTRMSREARLRAMTSIAETAQQALLPQPPREVGRLQVATGYLAAASDAHIGGDFYDVRPSPWGIRLLVGDVRGKGLDAVRMAGVVVAAFRERAEERADLSMLLADLDRAVRRESVDSEEFVTVTIAEFDDDLVGMRVALAGHPPPLLVRCGAARIVSGVDPGPPLGIGLGPPAAPMLIEPLHPGDRLLFYTDGTTEARSETGEFFPLPARATTLMGAGTLPAAVAAVLQAVQVWTRDGMQDDAALLAVEIGPHGRRDAGAGALRARATPSDRGQERHDVAGAVDDVCARVRPMSAASAEMRAWRARPGRPEGIADRGSRRIRSEPG